MQEMVIQEDAFQNWLGDGSAPAGVDPKRAAQAGLKTPLPKRFYSEVSTREQAEGYALLLDGKPAFTKAKNPLQAPNETLAGMLVAEWAAQAEVINPATMPLTRLLHAAIDSVSHSMEAVSADILSYAATDLICYRAGEPEGLVALQNTHWTPILDYIRTHYGARFMLVEGLMHRAQPPATLDALKPRLHAITAPLELAAMHVMTTLSGSALITLMVADGALQAQAGFTAGELDADYTASVWGKDAEAEARRASRLADFIAAAHGVAAMRA